MLSHNNGANENTESYQVVSRELGKTRLSGLYRFVKHLIDIDALEVSGYRVGTSSSETRAAIFLNFQKEKLNLFENLGYVCKDCHLTIDSKYAISGSTKGNKGFTYAHHTERYAKADNPDLVVRTYFDEQGEYLFHKISYENDAKTPVPFASQEAVLENAILSKHALTVLLKKKQSICESLNSEINELEVKLADILQAIILSDAEIQSYLELGLQCLDKIQQRNLLMDGLRDWREKQLRDTTEFNFEQN